MQYIGLDVHDKYTHVQQMDAQGFLGFSERIATIGSSFRSIFDELEDPASVSLEAGRSWWWISQLLLDHPKVAQVKVVDPRRSRHLSQELSVNCGYGRAKNDRIDAEMMAEADRLGLAPAIHLPNPEQLEKRTLVRYRFHLVGQHTMISNRLQGLLAMHGLRITTKRLLEDYEAQLIFLESLPTTLRFIVDEWLEQLHLYRRQLMACEDQLTILLPESHPDIQLLLSAPGIGIVVARIIVSELFSIENFKEPKYLISYIGLAPIEDESAGKKGIIKLNRHCNYYLKYAFMVAAHAARSHPKYRRKYDRDLKKHSKVRAKLNLARKIAKSVYWMLTRQQPFQ